METVDFIKELSELIPIRPTRTNRHVTTRCPFCGDSTKSHTHFHLYITTDTPHLYYCQRCLASGIFTGKTLRRFNVTDMEVETYLQKSYVKALKTRTINKLSIDSGITPIVMPEYESSELINSKFKYINDRLGINLTIDDVNKFRIVPDFRTFFAANNLLDYYKNMDGETKYLFKQLTDNAIGFLSHTNRYISFRAIDDNNLIGGKRYHILNLFNKQYDMTNKFYTISQKIDLTSIDTYELIMSEGAIDLVSLYNNVCDKDDNMKVYCAASGKDYVSAINYFIELGIKLSVKLFIDNDVENERYYIEKIRRNIPSSINLTIYKNSIGKDYGVKKELINLKRIF